jgi:spore germination protein YaaH
MKKTTILLVLLSIIGVCSWIFYFQPQETVSPLARLRRHTSPTLTPTVKPVFQTTSNALFVPYWSFGSKKISTDTFDTLLYFGVSTNTTGIDTDDIGYKKLQQFVDVTPAQSKKLLVIRMINTEVNSKVLDNKTAQQNIIQDSIAIAKKYGFSGIVLDFEIKALAFDSVVRNISQFYTSFSKQVHADNLAFDVTLYGDTFYLSRPYDVKEIGKSADRMYIMTYDFHKAGGDPGPNFPLGGKNTYGYDLQSMISDFGEQVSLEKVIVTFGLFGYDWTVDNKNQAKDIGSPLSFTDIQAKYINSCNEKNCISKRDTTSSETQITFTDEKGDKHIVWFEDPTSMEKKKSFLKTKGLNATGIWAYSYF